jgi:hypothetical protein
MRRILPLALILLAAPARAEAPMTAEEFEAHVTGRTLTYAGPSGIYGVERYWPGRRVTWSFLDGNCEDGSWYPEGEAICFVYPSEPEPQCWRFFRDGAGLRAEFTTDPAAGPLYEVAEAAQGLVCNGPGV